MHDTPDASFNLVYDFFMWSDSILFLCYYSSELCTYIYIYISVCVCKVKTLYYDFVSVCASLYAADLNASEKNNFLAQWVTIEFVGVDD